MKAQPIEGPPPPEIAPMTPESIAEALRQNARERAQFTADTGVALSPEGRPQTRSDR